MVLVLIQKPINRTSTCSEVARILNVFGIYMVVRCRHSVFEWLNQMAAGQDHCKNNYFILRFNGLFFFEWFVPKHSF